MMSSRGIKVTKVSDLAAAEQLLTCEKMVVVASAANSYDIRRWLSSLKRESRLDRYVV